MKEQYNRLVIIGNGFDLALGLNTRYTDFLSYYLKDCVKNALIEGSYEDEVILINYGKER